MRLTETFEIEMLNFYKIYEIYNVTSNGSISAQIYCVFSPLCYFCTCIVFIGRATNASYEALTGSCTIFGLTSTLLLVAASSSSSSGGRGRVGRFFLTLSFATI